MEVPSHDAKENDVEEVLDEDEVTTEGSSSSSDDHQSDNDGSPVGRKFSFHNLTTFTTIEEMISCSFRQHFCTETRRQKKSQDDIKSARSHEVNNKRFMFSS